MKAQILSTELVAPSSPTPSHLQSLELSCLDQPVHPYYVPFIFYYLVGSENSSSNNARNSEKLQKSLSDILTRYYPLAGRFTDDNLSVLCNDKGAEYVEAQVSGSLSDFMNRLEHDDTKLSDSLIPPQYESYHDSPLVKVQFNKFECGGVAIAICVSHKIADGFTMFSFIDAWATASRTDIRAIPHPSFELASICPSRNIPHIRIDAAKAVYGKETVMRSFVFDSGVISNLKGIVRASGSEDQKHQPTRVEVVIGLIWKTLIKLTQTRHGQLRPSLLAFQFNLRKRTVLPVPQNSCGNFTDMVIAQFTPDGESNPQLHDFVRLVHEGISNAIKKCGAATNGDQLFSNASDSSRQIGEAMGNKEVDVYFFTSWCRFPKYDADFGWGKPARVSCGNIPRNNCVLLDTKDGDGIEAWVSLDEHSMLLFQQNPDIVEFTSKMKLLNP